MQIQTSSLRIPRALINAPEEVLQQKVQDTYGFANRRKTYHEENISQATEAALLKYHPKYCHAIRLDSKPKRWSVISRIKQIKTISHFEYELKTTRKSFVAKTMKKLLGNKRKTLKSLPVIGFDEEPACRLRRLTAMEICYFFPQIETLKVRLSVWCLSENAKRDFIPGHLEDWILDRYGRFWDALKHVKHLDLDFNPNLWVVLPHLEKSQRFLTSLQSFRLTIMSYKMDSSDTPRKKFLTFLRTPDLLKHITHINFQRFGDNIEIGWFHYYGNQIKAILDCCTNLQSIIFPIEKELYSSQSQFASPKHYLTLAPLKSLNRLGSLDLMVYDTWSLMIAFELPEQLKRLALRLYDLYSIWNSKKRGKEEEKLLNKNQTLANFFEKVSKLTQLSSLELNFHLYSSPKDVLDDFIVPMLQAVPQIEKFECNFYGTSSKAGSLVNLSFLLKGIIPLNQLQSFKISQEAKNESETPKSQNPVITFIPEPHQTFSFPNITSIKIDPVISEDFDFRAFFVAFSEGSQTKQKEISLTKIHVTSIQSLLKLFKTFKEVEQFPKLKVNLNLVSFLEDWEDISKYLQETITPAKNVSINLKIYISSTDQTHPPAERITTLQKAFAKIKFSLTLLAKVREGSRWYRYERIVAVPIIRNNHYSAPIPLKTAQDEPRNNDSSVGDSNNPHDNPLNDFGLNEDDLDIDNFVDEDPLSDEDD